MPGVCSASIVSLSGALDFFDDGTVESVVGAAPLFISSCLLFAMRYLVTFVSGAAWSDTLSRTCKRVSSLCEVVQHAQNVSLTTSRGGVSRPLDLTRCGPCANLSTFPAAESIATPWPSSSCDVYCERLAGEGVHQPTPLSMVSEICSSLPHGMTLNLGFGVQPCYNAEPWRQTHVDAAICHIISLFPNSVDKRTR